MDLDVDIDIDVDILQMLHILEFQISKGSDVFRSGGACFKYFIRKNGLPKKNDIRGLGRSSVEAACGFYWDPYGT